MAPFRCSGLETRFRPPSLHLGDRWRAVEKLDTVAGRPTTVHWYGRAYVSLDVAFEDRTGPLDHGSAVHERNRPKRLRVISLVR